MGGNRKLSVLVTSRITGVRKRRRPGSLYWWSESAAQRNSAGSETDGAGERAMVGILVHGNNHYILSGPLPNEAEALAMARNWSLVQIGEQASPIFQRWEIRNKE